MNASVIRLEATIGFPFGIIFLRRFTGFTEHDYTRLLRVSGKYEITEIKVNTKSWLVDRPLKELGLQQEGVMVLGIYRKEGFYKSEATSGVKIEVWIRWCYTGIGVPYWRSAIAPMVRRGISSTGRLFWLKAGAADRSKERKGLVAELCE